MKRRKFHVKQLAASTTGLARSKPAVAIELMPLSALCERLEDRQRLFLRRGLVRLERLIRPATARHRENQPHPVKLQKTFVAFRERLIAHLREEAEIIFPLIRQVESRASGDTHAFLQTYTTHLEQQHFAADEAFAELRAVAENGCTRALRDHLTSFEHNLHEQIYEENRVLFPRALAASRA